MDIHSWYCVQRVGACVCNYGKQRATDPQLVISEGTAERWEVGEHSHAIMQFMNTLGKGKTILSAYKPTNFQIRNIKSCTNVHVHAASRYMYIYMYIVHVDTQDH